MNTNQTKNNLEINQTASQVLKRIEEEAIQPYGTWRFFAQEWGIWFVWGLSVIWGSLALAVTGYALLSAHYAIFEATHDNWLTFAISVMPYLWVAIFAIMINLTVVEVKKTNRGYRFTTFEILGSSVVFSIILAIVFHFFGFGYILDQTLGRQISGYSSMEKMEQMRWQSPQAGRLWGSFDNTNYQPVDLVTEIDFEDGSGQLWSVTISELRERDLALLASGKLVRLIGTSTSPQKFHACGVFPWLAGRAVPRREMQEGRHVFDDLRQFDSRGPNSNPPVVGSNLEKTTVFGDICGQLPMFQKMYQ